MELLVLLSVLFLAAIVVFPIYVLIRLSELARAVREIREELDRLRAPAGPERDAEARREALKRLRERAAAEVTPLLPSTAAPPEAAPEGPAPVAPPPPAAPPPPVPTPAALDWESLLGANWLSKLGIAALAVATGFFLKFAFESGWIGPTARVTIGLAAAAILLGVGQQLLATPRYRSYAQVLMSGGIIIFFLSVYAAFNFYHFIGFTPAFAALALGALAASALATANKTEAVAILCLLGAFFTPVLLHEGGTTPGDMSRLYFYLTGLNIWSAFLARNRAWHSLTILSFGATWLIFFGSQPGGKPDVLLFECFAGLFLLFSCYGGVARLTREAEPSREIAQIALALILVGCLAFAVISLQILAGSYLFGLPAFVLAGAFLVLLLIGLSVALPVLPRDDSAVRRPLLYLSAAALALLIGGAAAAAPTVSRQQALPGFAFAVVTYLVFLGLALALQRRPDGQGPAAALLLANGASHLAVACHVLAPIQLWSIHAAPLWLPLAGWITLLAIWPAARQASAASAFRKGLIVTAQALPAAALLGGLLNASTLSGWFGPTPPGGAPASLWPGLGIFWAEFLLVSATWLAARRLVTLPGLRGDLLSAFGNAATFFGLMSLAARLAAYQGLVILAGSTLLLAGYHALIGACVLRRPENDALRRLTYLGLAITFLTIAIPLQLRASYLTVAWAAESAVLIWSGVRAREARMRWYGLVLFLIAAGKALLVDLARVPAPERFLLNERMLSGAAIISAAAISAAALGRAREFIRDDERWLPPALALVANAFALIFGSVDLWRHLEGTTSLALRASAQQLSLSVFWSLYALAVMAVGIWRRARPARLFALALLYLSIIKVFILDLSALQQSYRIVSFFGLGLILLVVSLLYTRFEERLK
jgi:uncharacterized membrane protein